MSLMPFRTDLSCPSMPRTSTSASMSMPIASRGTSKSAALVAMPLVTQPARAARRSSGGKGAESTPPSGAGSSLVITKRRVRGMMLPPTAWMGPTVTTAFVPRSQVEWTFTVILPMAGFSRTIVSRCLTPSRFTSLMCSPIPVLLRPSGARSEQVRDHAGRALRAPAKHFPTAGGLAQVIDDGGPQRLRAHHVVVHADARAQAVEPARHVEVLLEVIAQREIEERRPERRQLHRGREASLHDGEMGGGVMPEQVGHVRARVDARPRGQLGGVEPRARDEQHARVGDPVGDERKGGRALGEEAPPHAGPARGDQDHPLVVAVAELAPERGLVRVCGGIEVVRVAREAK